jgi:hypothetical protein
MGFEISITDFGLLFSSFGIFLGFLWGIRKAIGLIK